MSEPEVFKIAAWVPWSAELSRTFDGPPYTHTVTPDDPPHWATGTDLDYPESDDEWQAFYWFEENDPETSARYTPPSPAFTFYVGDGPEPREARP